MRIEETQEKLIFETTFLEHLIVGTPLQTGSVVFDRRSRSVQIRQGFLRKTLKEIPFEQIQRIRHWMVASCYFVGGEVGPIVRSTPLEPNASELSLELYDRKKEILYRRGLRMKREGQDGRNVLRFIQGLADRISEFTGIPSVVRSDEVQGSFDIGSRRLTLHGECLPPSLKGTMISFEEILALRSIKTTGGYFAVEIQKKNGDVISTNNGFDTSSRLHETVEMIAKKAGIPFELQETVTTRPSPSRPYKPISPTSRG